MKNNYTRRDQTDSPAPSRRRRDDEPPRERRTRMVKKDATPSGKFNITKNPNPSSGDQQPAARRGRPASSESGRSRYSDDKPRDSRSGRSSAPSYGSDRRSVSKPSSPGRGRPSSSFSERNERFSDKPREERRARPASSSFNRPDRYSDKPREERRERPASSSFGSSDRMADKPREERRARPASSSYGKTERYSDKHHEERRARPASSSFDRSDRSSDKPREERRARPASSSFNRPERFSDKPREERWERPASSFSRTENSEKKPFDSGRRTTSGTRSFSSSERTDKVKKSYSDRSESSEFKPKRSFSEGRTSRNGRRKTSASASDEMRLNRFISNAGICSRRDADKWITAGMVTVNGNTITELGTKVSVYDDVRFDGQKLNPEKKVYVLLNKPKDFVTTTEDPHAEHTVMELVKTACNERIYPVGRLDKNTTGLLLFTNDGELSKKLTHPSHNIKKIYQVTLDKPLTKEEMVKISEGVELEDGIIAADAISYVDMDDKTEIGIEIHSGRNRVVRRLFEHLGYRVRKLDRVYFAGLTKKNIPRGKYRILTEKEVKFLKMN